MIQWIRHLVYIMIGDKVTKIQGDNIEIDGEMYMGSPGF